MKDVCFNNWKAMKDLMKASYSIKEDFFPLMYVQDF